MSEPLTIRRIPEHRSISGGRLGRQVRHDARSRLYRAVTGEVRVVTKTWPRNIAILDQGDVGSCTGNALTGALGTSPVFENLPAGHLLLDEALALRLYSEAEQLDGDGSYPPNDYGSSGLSVCTAGKADGFLSGYTHAFGMQEVLQALMAGPVLLGINWYSSFDQPGTDGMVKIDAGAWVRGGHEVLARGVDVASMSVLLDNSWGTGWGNAGSFSMGWDTLTRLLTEDGDATVPVPALLPAPVPIPVPVPDPADPDQLFALVAKPWVAHHHTGANAVMQRATKAWLAARGL